VTYTPEHAPASKTSTASVRATRIRGGVTSEGPESLVVEEPLRVHVEQGPLSHLLGSTMRTPGHDLELAVGLAVGEGVVSVPEQVLSVRPCGDLRIANEVTVTISDEHFVDPAKLARVSTPSSACGLCGRDEIDAVVASSPKVHSTVQVDVDVLSALPGLMRARQRIFERTGGLHAAALATSTGELLVVREDVGRHNAVDKVVGWSFLNRVPGDVLIVSGRAGFEIVQKAAMAAIPVVASVSAPTSLSVEVARACNITLAAFVREDRMTIYSEPARIVSAVDEFAES
jgi:FdhD protein